MIRVIALITTKPGKRQEFLASFNDIRPAVLAEKGCGEYVATIDHANSGAGRAQFGPDTVAIIETWASLEDLAAHGAGEPLKTHGRRTKELIEKRDVYVLSPT